MQQLQPNTTLQSGKYRIERVLGQGGFGITYLAVQTSLQRRVAIKEFFMKDFCSRNEATLSMQTPSTGSNKQVEQYKRKFIKEARNLSRLNHPNIISVIEVFEENDTIYYVMPYLSGGSLQDYVKSHGALSEVEAMKYVKQIAKALKYMHEKQHMCHFDVKPANILLDDKGNAMLIDFGISKNYDSSGFETTTTPVGMSEGYAPIEQYQQNVEEFSPVSDVYALGATLYFLLHGKRPVNAPSRAGGSALMMRKSLSQDVKNIINASMKVSKRERANSADVFLGNCTTSSHRNYTPTNDDDERTIIESSSKTEMNNTSYTQTQSSESIDTQTNHNNNSIIGWIVAVAIVLAILLYYGINVSGDSQKGLTLENSSVTSSDVSNQIGNEDTELNTVSEQKNKLADAIDKAKSEGIFLLSNNNRVYYLKDRMPSAGFDNTSSGCAHIYIFNVDNGSTSKVNIRLPSGLDDLQYEIDSYALTNNKINFILCQRGRNGYGIANYITEVAQYNTDTGKWRNIADGCAGAEFFEANRKIRLKWARVTNSDEVEFASEYKYEYTYEEITL